MSTPLVRAIFLVVCGFAMLVSAVAAEKSDYQRMLDQLGIKEMRPPADGWAKAGEPQAANYDPQKAGPTSPLPDPFTMQDGSAVDSPADWWRLRRPELVRFFEKEVYGEIPKSVPELRWEVVETSDSGVVDGIPVSSFKLQGKVDSSDFPEIEVIVEASVVLPKAAKSPVPLLVMLSPFSWDLPGETGLVIPKTPWPQPETEVPPSPVTLIRKGWGYAFLNTNSIQADNAEGLRSGIIGLTNHGALRSPEQWGALRAWAWGASRLFDFLQNDARVDAQRIGIEGVSRYGKAALVTMAFDQRFSMALIGSSGKGGVALHRRDFGERVENLASSGAYHWMAGNYLRYAAKSGKDGEGDINQLPVDSHLLLALCAPRLVYVSYGIPEMGDALWLDQEGSFMATVAASPVYSFLGSEGLGVEGNYLQAQMPPVLHGLLEGDLAWRQHAGGHEDRSNMQSFVDWVEAKQ